MRVVLQRVYEVTAWRAAARRRSVGRAGRAPGPGLPAALRGSRPVQEAPSWTAVSRAVPGNQAAQDAGAQSNPPRVARRAGARGQQGGGRRRTAHCTSRPAAAPSAAQRRGARGPTGPAPAGPPAAAACLSAASPAPRAPGALTLSAGAASTARLRSRRASTDPPCLWRSPWPLVCAARTCERRAPRDSTDPDRHRAPGARPGAQALQQGSVLMQARLAARTM